MAAPLRIDCHGHVWSDDPEKYPYIGGRSPPPPTDKLGTAEVLLKGMAEAGVSGFMIVQPIFHEFDDRYVTDTLAQYGPKFRGSFLLDPTLSPASAIEELKRLRGAGYVGVRFNSGLWAQKGTTFLDATGRAAMQACGKMGMVVGILCNNFREQAPVIETLAQEFLETKIVLDHFAGLHGETDPSWPKLLALAKYSNVYVKVSGWFRGGVELYGPATLSLLQAFGADRLMFGTDFPWVMGEGEAGYAEQWRVFDTWASENLTAGQTAAIAGLTAAELYSFNIKRSPKL